MDANNVKYVVISHSLAFSAQEVAALVHMPGREMAKTVMVSVRGKLVMAVLPASFNIDFTRLSMAIGTDNVYLATEGEFKECFPDCEAGAMPPFGNLYDIDVYVAESLAEDDEIAFNAGSHTDLVKMACAEFAGLVKPRTISFTNQHDGYIRPHRSHVYA